MATNYIKLNLVYTFCVSVLLLLDKYIIKDRSKNESLLCNPATRLSVTFSINK